MIFVDSSFWLALRRRDDRHHSAASTLWTSTSKPIVTSNHVIGETWTYSTRKLGHNQAVAFIDSVRDTPQLTVLHVDEHLESEAWDWLRQHDERVYSFVDATSFALMRRLGVTDAFAFDSDFAAAGFVELRP